ncbi:MULTISPECIES: c-type cytochrome [unclassified Sphingomonas]|uniref:c-type cytochrome n=1 Tax=unclassified Sphingomonas TaxID=196159 RepID=UPI002151EDC3|nr:MULTISPECIES: cytochrome c family protein [unclassified Sphingomonas]MCR5870375.1 cytochrome c family protein [Sphingomonas sp. J344]UUY01286.1 cytochrome c family protein [Sphingomonas sp. J315]
MDNRMNTIAGWVLFGCASALGLSIASGMIYHGGKPEKEGYPVESADGPEGGSGAAAVEPIANRLAKADVAKGQASFAKCAACHSITQGGANGVGPNLWASMGKPHGHVAGFAYSDALKAVPGNWTFEAMDAWLASPRKYAAGTKMTFAGLSDPQERANVIAYMNAQGSNLPLPAPEAAPAEGETEAGNEVTPTELGNAGTPASGAPSVDPAAAAEAAKKE